MRVCHPALDEPNSELSAAFLLRAKKTEKWAGLIRQLPTGRKEFS